MGLETIPHLNLSAVRNLRRIDFLDNEFAIFDDILNLPIAQFPSRVNSAVLGICLKGYCRMAINLQEYRLDPDMMLMILPEQIIQNIEMSPDFSGVFMIVEKDFLDTAFSRMKELLPFMFYIKDHPCTALEKTEVERMLEYHALLWKKVKMTDNVFRKEITKGIMLAMFYEMYNFCSQHMPREATVKSRKEDLFEKFLREVSNSYMLERRVSFYADKLCLTPKHLSGVVKEVSGKTAGEWIDNFVVLEAKALLKSSEMSIQEIAETLHFANQSFFGKYFKHYVGMSPKEYKKK